MRDSSPLAVEEYKRREAVGVGNLENPKREPRALAHDNRRRAIGPRHSERDNHLVIRKATAIA